MLGEIKDYHCHIPEASGHSNLKATHTSTTLKCSSGPLALHSSICQMLINLLPSGTAKKA